ncbi:hypothetical protein FALBO_8389 [Fusarium albosuccineum]|uniref:Uncharacterized protein n=1 Tax=Fusarium albosuccineum TaxID=1237068 RepID=A0A8H4LAQ9_9HYPO|nr:hypothetical protein FALBO_8389 [Fusarium albosuccineum]
MTSPPPSQRADEQQQQHLAEEGNKPASSQDTAMSNPQKRPYANSKTPEPPHVESQATHSDAPDTPGNLEPFDWDEFEARYESALHHADEQERGILKEAEALSKYFKVWASAASAHDDERAAKRLQTRRRFVNLSEERMQRKQEHYDQVVTAFERALALLKSHFGSTFVSPPDQEHCQDDATYDLWEEDDDGLGYYPDGAKRTLTDEQIEIFRHSELEALRKEEEKKLSTKMPVPSDETMDLSEGSPAPSQSDAASSALPTSFQSNKKRKKKKGPKRGRPEPKPDLRKRTWDIVDKGLDSLDYD